MPDDSERLQLAGLASTGSRGYSAPTLRNDAGLGKRGLNVRSDGFVQRIAVRRVRDRS
jgi:hypothetical protein